MTYEELRARWRARALLTTTSLIESLCELRDLLVELPTMREQIMLDFATDYGKAQSTVKDYLHIIGGYTAEDMQRWVNAGLRFDHMEKAKQFADAKHMTPAALLNYAIGNGEDGKNMTVDEMERFCLSEKDTSGGARWKFQRVYSTLAKFPSRYGWDDATADRYEKWLKAGWEFFE